MFKKLNEAQINELIRKFNEKSEIHPTWRKGQTWFNSLRVLYPSVADYITDTENDPFYDDEKIDNFFKEIMES